MTKSRWPVVGSDHPLSILDHAESLHNDFEAIANFVKEEANRAIKNGTLPKRLKRKISAGITSGIEQALADGFLRKSKEDRNQVMLHETILQHIEQEAAKKARDRIPLYQFQGLFKSFSDLVRKLSAWGVRSYHITELSPVSASNTELNISDSADDDHPADQTSDDENSVSAQGEGDQSDVDTDSQNSASTSAIVESRGGPLMHQRGRLQNEIVRPASSFARDIGGPNVHDEADKNLEGEAEKMHGKEDETTDKALTVGYKHEDGKPTEDEEQNHESCADATSPATLLAGIDEQDGSQKAPGKFVDARKLHARDASGNDVSQGRPTLTEDDTGKPNRDVPKPSQDLGAANNGDRQLVPCQAIASGLPTNVEANSVSTDAEGGESKQKGELNQNLNSGSAIPFVITLTIKQQSTVNHLESMLERRMLQIAIDSFKTLSVPTEIQLINAALCPRGDVEVTLRAETREILFPSDLGSRWGIAFERWIGAPLGSYPVEVPDLHEGTVNLRTRREKATTIRNMVICNAPMMKTLFGHHVIVDIHRHCTLKHGTRLVVQFSTADLAGEALRHGLLWRNVRYACTVLAENLHIEELNKRQQDNHSNEDRVAGVPCKSCGGQHATKDCTYVKQRPTLDDATSNTASKDSFLLPERLTNRKTAGSSTLAKDVVSQNSGGKQLAAVVPDTPVALRQALPANVPTAPKADREATLKQHLPNLENKSTEHQSHETAAVTAMVQSLQAEIHQLRTILIDYTQQNKRRADSEVPASVTESPSATTRKRIRLENQPASDRDQLEHHSSPTLADRIGGKIQGRGNKGKKRTKLLNKSGQRYCSR